MSADVDASIAPVGPGGLRPPAPSLIGKLLPMLRSSEAAMTAAIQQLDDVATWDSAQTNHEGLLVSLDELQAQRAEWQTAMLNGLQALWVREAKAYTDYKLKIERTLANRHVAELGNMFPRMRKGVSGGGSTTTTTTTITTSTSGKGGANASSAASGTSGSPLMAADADAATGGKQQDDAAVLDALRLSQEQNRMRAHANRLGFNFDPNNNRLVLLVQRQMKEEAVFTRVTSVHVELLASAKRDDAQRLRAMLQQISTQLDALVQKVERKVHTAVKNASASGGSLLTSSATTAATGGVGSVGSHLPPGGLALKPQPPTMPPPRHA